MQTKPKQQADLQDDELRVKINRETARLPWAELERHFAQGNVVYVSTELDLIDVAVRISHDDRDSISRWMNDGKVAKVTDAQAQSWALTDAVLWASVVSPFVLVQPQKSNMQ